MSLPLVPRVGGILSADIAVPAHEREVRFYSRVLCTGESPLWRADLVNNQGTPIIGLGARGPDLTHLPVAWMPHIQVADVAASVACALALGGAELMHARDDDGASQWAVLRDPGGAAFGVIPVVPEAAIPPSAPGEPGEAGAEVGRIAWFDLTVPDADATRDFYREVIGWSVERVEMGEAGQLYDDYNMVGGDGAPAAGICHARGVNEGLPPVWMMYLPVGDLDESLRRVRAEGGTVHEEREGPGGQIGLAVVQDPVGAWFALVCGG